MATGAAHGRIAPAAAGGEDGSTSPGVPADALLGRPAFVVEAGPFTDYLAGTVVAVTGAAGSVGGALSKRLARLAVRELVLIDQSEAGLVDLARELEQDDAGARVTPVLADIRNRPRIASVLARHRPEVVFHAAAYKQVPLLEDSPAEAVAVNVLGTEAIVDAACAASVRRFVLFSTDKAVHPTNVLGQTKAIGEWIVAGAAHGAPHVRFAAIRLGNVADSAGSILPVLRRQVANGGPVTITHPDVTRFLMTVDEAVSLAVLAGAFADSASIYWLDLRPAVRIVDLVRRLAGDAAGRVPIEFIGLRPGERISERLVWEDDTIEPTLSDRVFRSPLRGVPGERLEACLAELGRQVERASAPGIRAVLAELHVAPDASPATAGR